MVNALVYDCFVNSLALTKGVYPTPYRGWRNRQVLTPSLDNEVVDFAAHFPYELDLKLGELWK